MLVDTTRVREITQFREFQDLLDAGEPFVVWFGATWCGPCRALDASALLEAANRLKIAFLHCDVDNGKRIAQACGIQSIPTFIAFNNGEIGARYSSSRTADVISKFLEKLHA